MDLFLIMMGVKNSGVKIHKKSSICKARKWWGESMQMNNHLNQPLIQSTNLFSYSNVHQWKQGKLIILQALESKRLMMLQQSKHCVVDVKFLHPKGPAALVFWPSFNDIGWIPIKNIITKVDLVSDDITCARFMTSKNIHISHTLSFFSLNNCFSLFMIWRLLTKPEDWYSIRYLLLHNSNKKSISFY